MKDSVDKEIDATIECSGFESSMKVKLKVFIFYLCNVYFFPIEKSALAITKSGGVVCCVGLHDSSKILFFTQTLLI